MCRSSRARNSFKGSCGHQIEAGTTFLIVEQSPTFECPACGCKHVEETLARLKSTLEVRPK